MVCYPRQCFGSLMVGLIAVWLAVTVGYAAAVGNWLVVGGLVALGVLLFVPSFWLLTLVTFLAHNPGLQTSLLTVSSVDIRPVDLLFVLLVLRTGIEEKGYRFTPGMWAVAGWLLALIPGFFNAVFLFGPQLVFYQIVAFGRFLIYVGFGLILPSVLRTPADLQRFLRLQVFVAIVEAVVAIFQFSVAGTVVRVTGTTSVADLGLFMAVVTVGLLSYDRISPSTWAKALSPFFALTMVLTMSKAALVSCLVAVGTLVKSRGRVGLVLGIIGMAVVVMIWFPGVVGFIAQSITEGVKGRGTVAERLALAQGALFLGLQHPFIGTGWSSFIWRSSTVLRLFPYELARVTAATQPHSGYLQLFVDSGLIGLSAFVLLLSVLVGRVRRCSSSPVREIADASRAVAPGLVVIAVWLAFDQILPGTSANFLFWQLCGFILALEQCGVPGKMYPAEREEQ